MVGELEGAKPYGISIREAAKGWRHGSFRKAEEVLRKYNVGKVEKDWDKKNQKKNNQSQFTPQSGAIYLSQNKHFDVNFNALYM